MPDLSSWGYGIISRHHLGVKSLFDLVGEVGLAEGTSTRILGGITKQSRES